MTTDPRQVEDPMPLDDEALGIRDVGKHLDFILDAVLRTLAHRQTQLKPGSKL